MVRQVRVLYDFNAEPGTGELSIREGELLQVTKTTVGEGWWEGTNQRGETGLFPEAYVEALEDSAPPAIAPPPLPQAYNAPAANPVDDWSADPWTVPAATPWTNPAAAPPPQQATQPEWGDDDYDSDFDEDSISQVGSQVQYPNLQNQNAQGNQLGVTGPTSNLSGSTGDINSIGGRIEKKSSTSHKASFNRFSLFVKSGSENYILGKAQYPVPEGEHITILEVGDSRYGWLSSGPSYSCIIASPKKDSKFKGLKSFIAYQLTPSFNNIQVSRRYKHFDWLHERLTDKYHFIPIPPLPDKQIQGRYEEEFIEHRMNQLQNFVDRVCRHPILSQSEVWRHFLTCTDEKRWKSGKRKAEKDSLVGGYNFLSLKVPEKTLEPGFVDTETHIFSEFTVTFDSAVKNMAKVASEQTIKCQNDYSRDFSTMGRAFTQLGQAMEQDGGNYSPGLNSAVINTGDVYDDIGKLYEEQPRLDWEHLADMMHDYKGLLSGFPNILHIQSGAQGKHREVESDSKVGPAEAAALRLRTNTVNFALLAEVNTFHEQRVKDIKSAHQRFLQEQIKFYQKITEKLQENLRLYDQC